MPRCSAKVPVQKATAVPGSVSNEGSEAAQKGNLAPKGTAKPAGSKRHVSLVNIPLTTQIICANRSFPSLMKAVTKKLTLVRQTSRAIPHRRRTNLSPTIYSTLLLLGALRTHAILAEKRLTSTIFSPSVQLRAQKCKYAIYARESCFTCRQPSNKYYTSAKHGYESRRMSEIKNFMYKLNTGKGNCRKHLIANHATIYDKTVVEMGWSYPLSTETPGARTTVADLRRRTLPQFTSGTFLDYLVRFIVADDQVSSIFLFLIHVLTSS